MTALNLTWAHSQKAALGRSQSGLAICRSLARLKQAWNYVLLAAARVNGTNQLHVPRGTLLKLVLLG